MFRLIHLRSFWIMGNWSLANSWRYFLFFPSSSTKVNRVLYYGVRLTLNPPQGVSTLAEGQESLERAYLDTRAQFRVLEQRQGRPLSFDPNRWALFFYCMIKALAKTYFLPASVWSAVFMCAWKRELEGQIFTSGMRLEELKERVKQNQTTLEPPATPPPHWDMLSLSMLETEPLPKVP